MKKYPLVVLHDEETVKSVVLLGDRATISSNRIRRETGEMIAPVTIARAGIMLYKAKELGEIAAHLPPEKICRVRTKPEVLFSEETMTACRSIPLTIGHPAKDVDITNNKELQKGFLEGTPEPDGSHLSGFVVINDAAAIRMIDAGIDQISLGQSSELEVCADDEADFDKVRIIPNHMALLRNGRAQTTRIGDSGEEIAIVDRSQFDAVEAERDALKTKVEGLTQKLHDAESVRLTDEAIQTMVEEKVTSRLALITSLVRLGDGMADMDFSGQTEKQIRRTVVAKLMDKDISDKSDEYVLARFEVALEDAESVTLSDALGQSMLHGNGNKEPKQPRVNPRDEALKRRQERLNK